MFGRFIWFVVGLSFKANLNQGFWKDETVGGKVVAL